MPAKTLLVMTPSLLANEVLSHLAATRPGDYLVFHIGDRPDTVLPQGSVALANPSYRAFLRFLDANKCSEAVFAAHLRATSGVWVQVLLQPRLVMMILGLLARGTLPSAHTLLNHLAGDLKRRNIQIAHPHSMCPQLKIKAAEQVRGTLTHQEVNDFKRLVVHFRRSARIVRESVLLGINDGRQPELLREEATTTDHMVGQLDRAAARQFARVILFKRSNDPSNITYPVIGPATIRLAAQRGISDVIVTQTCVVQAKDETLLLCRRNGISLTVLDAALPAGPDAPEGIA